ncbi:MAG: RimK/LysX family protein [Porticoccaceae bacterium]
MRPGESKPPSRLHALICLMAASLLLAACESTPQQSEAPATPAVEQASELPPQTAPEVVLPEEPPAPVCPEPEPVPVPTCPPPPKPKPCPVCPAAKVDGKMLVGQLEHIRLDPPGVTYTARIDSGAEGSSIHATNIVTFERDGKRWVKFELDMGKKEEPVTMEREVVRRVMVRQVTQDEAERRVKVMMRMTLGSFSDMIEFSLNDRSAMEYPVLIGRDFLRNNAVVDVSQEFIAK